MIMVPLFSEMLNEPQYDTRHHWISHTHQIRRLWWLVHLCSGSMTFTKPEISTNMLQMKTFIIKYC